MRRSRVGDGGGSDDEGSAMLVEAPGDEVPSVFAAVEMAVLLPARPSYHVSSAVVKTALALPALVLGLSGRLSVGSLHFAHSKACDFSKSLFVLVGLSLAAQACIHMVFMVDYARYLGGAVRVRGFDASWTRAAVVAKTGLRSVHSGWIMSGPLWMVVVMLRLCDAAMAAAVAEGARCSALSAVAAWVCVYAVADFLLACAGLSAVLEFATRRTTVRSFDADL